MKTSVFQNQTARLILSLVLSLVIFAAIAALFVGGLHGAADAQAAEALRTAEESIRRAAVSCYAIEGFYPDSYEYLREHYGLRVDTERFAVHYEIFASNIMPSVTVTYR